MTRSTVFWKGLLTARKIGNNFRWHLTKVFMILALIMTLSACGGDEGGGDSGNNNNNDGDGSTPATTLPTFPTAAWTVHVVDNSADTFVGEVRGIAYDSSDNIYLATGIYDSGNGKTGVAISSDGITWNPGTRPSDNGYSFGLTRNSTAFYSVSGKIQSTTDGQSWTDSPMHNDLTAAYANADTSIYLAMSSSGGLYSSDLIKFTMFQTDLTADIHSVTGNGDTSNDEILVAVGVSGKIIRSTDGINWAEASDDTAAGSATLRAVIHDTSMDLFIAVGDSGKIITSPDGDTWTDQTSDTSETLVALTSENPGRIVALADNGNTTTSPDGVNWTADTTTGMGTTNMTGIAYNGSQYLAFDFNGGLYYTNDPFSDTGQPHRLHPYC